MFPLDPTENIRKANSVIKTETDFLVNLLMLIYFRMQKQHKIIPWLSKN